MNQALSGCGHCLRAELRYAVILVRDLSVGKEKQRAKTGAYFHGRQGDLAQGEACSCPISLFSGYEAGHKMRVKYHWIM